MDIRHLTLSDVLDFHPNELSSDVWSRIKSREGVKELRRPLEAANLPGGWAGLGKEVLARAPDLLDISLLDIMRWAWMKGHELETYRDPIKYPPDKKFRVSLVEHKIRSTHTPHVEVRLNNKVVVRVHFMATVEIAVKAMTLEIQNARIRKIHAGDCTAKGSFSCEGFLLVERESKPLDLPGTIDFGEGLEI